MPTNGYASDDIAARAKPGGTGASDGQSLASLLPGFGNILATRSVEVTPGEPVEPPPIPLPIPDPREPGIGISPWEPRPPVEPPPPEEPPPKYPPPKEPPPDPPPRETVCNCEIWCGAVSKTPLPPVRDPVNEAHNGAIHGIPVGYFLRGRFVLRGPRKGPRPYHIYCLPDSTGRTDGVQFRSTEWKGDPDGGWLDRLKGYMVCGDTTMFDMRVARAGTHTVIGTWPVLTCSMEIGGIVAPPGTPVPAPSLCHCDAFCVSAVSGDRVDKCTVVVAPQDTPVLSPDAKYLSTVAAIALVTHGRDRTPRPWTVRSLKGLLSFQSATEIGGIVHGRLPCPDIAAIFFTASASAIDLLKKPATVLNDTVFVTWAGSLCGAIPVQLLSPCDLEKMRETLTKQFPWPLFHGVTIIAGKPVGAAGRSRTMLSAYASGASISIDLVLSLGLQYVFVPEDCCCIYSTGVTASLYVHVDGPFLSPTQRHSLERTVISLLQSPALQHSINTHIRNAAASIVAELPLCERTNELHCKMIVEDFDTRMRVAMNALVAEELDPLKCKVSALLFLATMNPFPVLASVPVKASVRRRQFSKPQKMWHAVVEDDREAHPDHLEDDLPSRYSCLTQSTSLALEYTVQEYSVSSAKCYLLFVWPELQYRADLYVTHLALLLGDWYRCKGQPVDYYVNQALWDKIHSMYSSSEPTYRELLYNGIRAAAAAKINAIANHLMWFPRVFDSREEAMSYAHSLTSAGLAEAVGGSDSDPFRWASRSDTAIQFTNDYVHESVIDVLFDRPTDYAPGDLNEIRDFPGYKDSMALLGADASADGDPKKRDNMPDSWLVDRLLRKPNFAATSSPRLDVDVQWPVHGAEISPADAQFLACAASLTFAAIQVTRSGLEAWASGDTTRDVARFTLEMVRQVMPDLPVALRTEALDDAGRLRTRIEEGIEWEPKFDCAVAGASESEMWTAVVLGKVIGICMAPTVEPYFPTGYPVGKLVGKTMHELSQLTLVVSVDPTEWSWNGELNNGLWWVGSDRWQKKGLIEVLDPNRQEILDQPDVWARIAAAFMMYLVPWKWFQVWWKPHQTFGES